MRATDAPILTAAEMRAVEAACFARGTSQAELMECAAAAVAREAARFARGRSILVLGGPGNNGGDAFAAARLLAAAGHDVTVGALGGRWSGAAEAMQAAWRGPTVDLADAPAQPVVVDGLFGIGLSRPIEGEVATAIARLRAAAGFVLAIDIASGLDADTGAAAGAVLRADATLALGAVKRGHLQGEGVAATGALLVDPIGLAVRSEVRMLAQPRIAPPGSDDHKYTRGLVGVVGGAMPGAARLAATAAARGGSGYVVLASADARVPLDAVVHREEIDPDRAAAVLVGPGLGRDDKARRTCEQWLTSNCALVIDGDALALVDVDSLARRPAPTILTPHAGEFARLFGPPAGDRIAAALEAARRSKAIVVLKGAATVIAAPDGSARVVQPPAWLSTAGTGDVLAGLVAARLAATRAPMRAACEAVWLHARAARLAGPALVADDLPMHIPHAIAECL
ncbi:bifunctional ADP-dependent NAD(P)H-hydrate dehydratase/NAD(P)H-hydrate epimerase [Sphingomonas spermidinifaciens]|uniref:Bifunctional NAD(P)H-hydrate repair enzyme n=1 Tax=Sphingomonas spermidinifaciens TaxID=1141889 RepID=A0A2A4B9D9_9SPHN|nr:NAD(P)H-hydrate dehydratase [Sphingomonas spermidinifaciens]PCD04687.1 bifunctional ADP-dependent NAD(P)H-hydrate dehydratase/NAD(P)H-hydrate epimerase [Sphingomonas spermidinifaciens]